MPANGRWDLIRRLKVNKRKAYVTPTLEIFDTVVSVQNFSF